NPPLFEVHLDHRMQRESQSRLKGVGRQTEATWKNVIRTLPRQGAGGHGSTLKKDRIAAKASAVPESPRALDDGTTATDTESPKG
ncbi:hypothetical protein BHM03_00043369, partial [Ensete ventricosum]